MLDPTVREVPDKTIDERSSAGDGRPEDVLPGPLGERFAVIGELSAGGGGTRGVFRVRDQDDRELVVKLYRGVPPGLEAVWAALRKAKDRHIVKPVECGQVGGHAYEITEYVDGGSLDDLLRDRGELPVELVRQVVEQVAAALRELHELGVRHRDIKPGNILMRSADPLSIALTDFGVSRRAADNVVFTRDFAGTPRYMAPEAPQAISPDSDYWSLGMTVAELAIGAPLLGFTDEQVLWFHIHTRPIDVSPVEDRDLRTLCQGLLIRNPDQRWGAEEVRAWLDGRPPRLPRDEGTVLAARPLRFGDVEHVTPDSLAAALSRDWEAGLRWTASHEAELVDWLGQFSELGSPGEFIRSLGRSAESPDVRHLRLLRWLNPRGKPYYRGVRITVGDLASIAANAASNVPGVEREIVADLWRYRLLEDLDAARQGSGLAERDARWREATARWAALVRRLAVEHDVRRALGDIDPEVVGAGLLVLACTGQEHRDAQREQARETAARLARNRTPVPWYTGLVENGGDVAALAAVLLADAALARSASMVEEWRRYAEERRRRAWREWFDRNQRTTALGWAALAVLVVAVGWVVVMTVADVIPAASPRSIAWGWVSSALSVLVIAATEVLLAARIGADYHPEYSLAADLIDVGGFAAHPLRGRRWAALAVFAGALAVLVAAMIFAPVALPVAATAAHLWRLRIRAGRRRTGQELVEAGT